MNFWDWHGWWFLLGLICVPRIALFFFSATPFTFFYWLLWAFFPNTLVAILAASFWETNPALVLVSWFVCLCKWHAALSDAPPQPQQPPPRAQLRRV